VPASCIAPRGVVDSRMPIEITGSLLLDIMPRCTVAGQNAEHLNRAMQLAKIDTAQRAAAFLAQIAHESGELRWVEELASGDAYEGRVDLGNTETGDGRRFKGRSWLQVTGRTNYRRCGEALKLDLIAHPEFLCQPANASRGAAWFWESKQLNALADRDQFGLISKRINGGYNGLDERIAFWLRARRTFGL
jgi:putative chitinase